MAQADSVATLVPPKGRLATLAGQIRQLRSGGAHAVVLSGSLIMLVSMLLVNLFNFAYNVFMARKLGPSDFGHINAAVTMLLIASCVSLAFQLVCTKFIVRNATPETKAGVFHSLLGKSWIISLALGAGLFLAQKPVASYLNLPDPWIVGVLAIGIAVYAPVGVKRGAMQGLCSFSRLGGNFVLEAMTRFAVGVVLVLLGYGALGAVGAISAAVLAAYFVPPVPRELRVSPEVGEPPSFAEALQAIVFFVGQVIINNVDILMVKHFFAPGPAGVYAALAQVGRLLYFVCWFGVVNAMFPVSAGTSEDGKEHSHTLLVGLVLVLGISVVFVLLVALFPHLIMGVIFGSKFVQTESLLALYAAATALYSLSVVLIAYEMSRRIANTGWLQLLFSGALVVVIGSFHGTLREVVMVRIVLMSLMLVLVAFPFLRRGLRVSWRTSEQAVPHH
ncbi:MAG TPA: oligosaccharide flippase family protein [Candidatus Angelobacter sp.]|nr:oligosaccharide flippase family protein [Candidatus Angelobacter sp.]